MTYFDSSDGMLLVAVTRVSYGQNSFNIPYLSNQPKMACPEISLKCQPQNLFKIIPFRGLESSLLAVMKYQLL